MPRFTSPSGSKDTDKINGAAYEFSAANFDAGNANVFPERINRQSFNNSIGFQAGTVRPDFITRPINGGVWTVGTDGFKLPDDGQSIMWSVASYFNNNVNKYTIGAAFSNAIELKADNATQFGATLNDFINSPNLDTSLTGLEVLLTMLLDPKTNTVTKWAHTLDTGVLLEKLTTGPNDVVGEGFKNGFSFDGTKFAQTAANAIEQGLFLLAYFDDVPDDMDTGLIEMAKNPLDGIYEPWRYIK